MSTTTTSTGISDTTWNEYVKRMIHSKELEDSGVGSAIYRLYVGLKGEPSSFEIDSLKPLARAMVHKLVEGLKDVTSTSLNKTGAQMGTIRIDKGDAFDLDKFHENLLGVIAKIPPKPLSRKQIARQKKESEMAKWSTTCDDCGKALNAYTAMFHYSGLGPFCEDCISADDELDGLKWESRESFW